MHKFLIGKIIINLPQQKNKLPYKISPVMMNLLYFSNKAPQSHASSMWAKEAMNIKGTTVSRPVTETGQCGYYCPTCLCFPSLRQYPLISGSQYCAWLLLLFQLIPVPSSLKYSVLLSIVFAFRTHTGTQRPETVNIGLDCFYFHWLRQYLAICCGRYCDRLPWFSLLTLVPNDLRLGLFQAALRL